MSDIKPDDVIAEMGVDTRCKVSQTEARMLELPGAGNDDKVTREVDGDGVAVTQRCCGVT